MRIAFSGSHATGKSTLVSEMAHRLGSFTVIDEPYYLLDDEGHAFATPPSLDDFESLLDRSISLLAWRGSEHVLFDRSPADYLAYMMAVGPERVSRDRVAEVEAAMATLALVVFVPIERPDRVEGVESRRLRRHVDRILREMLVDGGWAVNVPVVEVHGTPTERANQVQAKLAPMEGNTSVGRGRVDTGTNPLQLTKRF